MRECTIELEHTLQLRPT